MYTTLLWKLVVFRFFFLHILDIKKYQFRCSWKSFKNVDSNLPQILGETTVWPFCAYLFKKCYFFIASVKS